MQGDGCKYLASIIVLLTRENPLFQAIFRLLDIQRCEIPCTFLPMEFTPSTIVLNMYLRDQWVNDHGSLTSTSQRFKILSCQYRPSIQNGFGERVASSFATWSKCASTSHVPMGKNLGDGCVTSAKVGSVALSPILSRQANRSPSNSSYPDRLFQSS